MAYYSILRCIHFPSKQGNHHKHLGARFQYRIRIRFVFVFVIAYLSCQMYGCVVFDTKFIRIVKVFLFSSVFLYVRIRPKQQMDFRCYCLSRLRNSYKFVIKFICFLQLNAINNANEANERENSKMSGNCRTKDAKIDNGFCWHRNWFLCNWTVLFCSTLLSIEYRREVDGLITIICKGTEI